MRSAAAVILVVGLGTIVAAWLFRPAMAFAEAARKIRDAQTLAYRTTTQIAGQPGPLKTRVLFKAPALMRSETVPDGPVTVFDAARNRTLVLDPASKSALLMEGPAPADGHAADMVAKEVEGLRKLVERKGEFVGRRRIGAIDADGFRVLQREQELVVWVDPAAKVPLRVDLKSRINDIEITGSLDDFQIDPGLDDRLFRFEPPAGYSLTKGENAGMSDEAAIVDMLRTYAEHAEETFPPGSTTGWVMPGGSPRERAAVRSTRTRSGSPRRSLASRSSCSNAREVLATGRRGSSSATPARFSSGSGQKAPPAIGRFSVICTRRT